MVDDLVYLKQSDVALMDLKQECAGLGTGPLGSIHALLDKPVHCLGLSTARRRYKERLMDVLGRDS